MTSTWWRSSVGDGMRTAYPNTCSIKRETCKMPESFLSPRLEPRATTSGACWVEDNKNTICLWNRGTAADAALSYADTFPDSVVDRSRAQN